MSSLKGVKVGDRVIIVGSAPQGRGWEEKTVEIVGRKYVTVGGMQFSIEDGQKKPPNYGWGYHCWTSPQWEVIQIKDELQRLQTRLTSKLQEKVGGNISINKIKNMRTRILSFLADLEKAEETT